MSIMLGAGWDSEAPVEVQDELGQVGIALLHGGDAPQAQFFDQAILQGLVGALDTSFGLGGVGAQDLNVQLLHGPSKLGQALCFAHAGLIDPENAMFVAVEGHRLAMTRQIDLHQLGVRVKAFLFDKQQSAQLPGRIVNGYQQVAGWTPFLKPGVRRTNSP